MTCSTAGSGDAMSVPGYIDQFDIYALIRQASGHCAVVLDVVCCRDVIDHDLERRHSPLDQVDPRCGSTREGKASSRAFGLVVLVRPLT